MALTEDDVIQINYEHYTGLFPKVCASCGRQFATLRDYVRVTERVGATISYDAEVKDWMAPEPLGAVALANCPCGSTLALSTHGIPVETRHLMLEWIRTETERRGVGPAELLDRVRNEIRKRALAD